MSPKLLQQGRGKGESQGIAPPGNHHSIPVPCGAAPPARDWASAIDTLLPRAKAFSDPQNWAPPRLTGGPWVWLVGPADPLLRSRGYQPAVTAPCGMGLSGAQRVWRWPDLCFGALSRASGGRGHFHSTCRGARGDPEPSGVTIGFRSMTPSQKSIPRPAGGRATPSNFRRRGSRQNVPSEAGNFVGGTPSKSRIDDFGMTRIGVIPTTRAEIPRGDAWKAGPHFPVPRSLARPASAITIPPSCGCGICRSSGRSCGDVLQQVEDTTTMSAD